MLVPHTNVFGAPQYRLLINNDEYNFDITPQLFDGKIYVPLRYTLSAFDAAVSYDERTNSVMTVQGGREVRIFLDDRSVSVDGAAKSMDGVRQTNGSVFVSLDFLKKVYGADASFDETSGTVRIVKADYISENWSDKLPDIKPELTMENLFAAPVTGAQYGKVEKVTVDGMPFDTALKLTTEIKPENTYSYQLDVETPNDINSGDVVLGRFYAKMNYADNETKLGQIGWVYELNSGSYSKLSNEAFSIKEGWNVYYWRFKASKSYRSDQTHITLKLGYCMQEVEVGGFEFFNYGGDVDISDLPNSNEGYEGSKADAKWRKAANERIDKYRKADLAVTVTDRNGNAVVGAETDIKMTRHNFRFGTAIKPSIMHDSYDGQRYVDAIKKYFNTVTYESGMKWNANDNDEYITQLTKNTINWCLDNGIEVRGHNLVWDDPLRFMPADVSALLDDKEKLNERIDGHIRYMAENFKGGLCDWDVLNEPTEKNTIQTKYGLEQVKHWFDLTRSIDPSAKLYVNDYTIGTASGTALSKRFLEILSEFNRIGVDYDGVGIQSHMSAVYSPMDIYDQYTQVAELGKRVLITEYGLYITDEKLQGEFTRDFMTMCFSHPSVDGFIIWGLWDGDQAFDNAPMFRKDWSLKPAGEHMVNLITREWSTDVSRITDDSGKAFVRGFKGDYDITVHYDGKSEVFRTNLESDTELTLQLSGNDGDEHFVGEPVFELRKNNIDTGDVYVSSAETAAETDRTDDIFAQYIEDGEYVMDTDFSNAAYGEDGRELESINTDKWNAATSKPTSQYIIKSEDGNRYLNISTDGTVATDPFVYRIFGDKKCEGMVISAKLRTNVSSNAPLYFDLASNATKQLRIAAVEAAHGGGGYIAFGEDSGGTAYSCAYEPDTWVTVTAVLRGMYSDTVTVDYYLNGEKVGGNYHISRQRLGSVNAVRIYTKSREGYKLDADADDVKVLKFY